MVKYHILRTCTSANKKSMSSGVKVGYSPSLTEALSNTSLWLRSIVYVFKYVIRKRKRRRTDTYSNMQNKCNL